MFVDTNRLRVLVNLLLQYHIHPYSRVMTCRIQTWVNLPQEISEEHQTLCSSAAFKSGLRSDSLTLQDPGPFIFAEKEGPNGSIERASYTTHS